jgi:cytochrome c5
MKRIIAFSLLIAVAAVACHKKTVPTVADRTELPPPPPPPAAPVVDMAAGKTIYETKCNKCHAPKVLDAYTTERWAGILKSMIPKAKLNADESAQVTAYVNANAKKA